MEKFPLKTVKCIFVQITSRTLVKSSVFFYIVVRLSAKHKGPQVPSSDEWGNRRLAQYFGGEPTKIIRRKMPFVFPLY